MMNPTRLDEPIPVPSSYTGSFDYVDCIRQDECVFEADCIDYAAREDWSGFTCVKCIYFKGGNHEKESLSHQMSVIPEQMF